MVIDADAPEATRVKPQPNSVWYNDWRQVDVEPLDAFTPTMPVSVIIPYYQTHAATLRMTLATLERQTYPRDMFEVIIVDDGSDPPLERPIDTALDVKVVRQERRGFGLARARNNGARAAAHDILLFFDSDGMPEPSWMSAHARWHHVVSDALTFGPYLDIALDGIDLDTIRRWRGSLKELFSDSHKTYDVSEQGYVLRSNNLTSRADNMFKVIPGGNLGISKWFYELVGGHDESFKRWGMEDGEFAYRAYIQGGLLIPDTDAFGWHQGALDADLDAKARRDWLQRGKVANLIAHPDFRGVRSVRIFEVPQYVVTVDGKHGSTDLLIETVMNILEDRVHDLVIRIETPDAVDDKRLARLREWFCLDPRVRVAPTRSALDEFPASPFHVTLPAAVFAKGVVHRLRVGLGSAVSAAATFSDGTQASITRAWALNRARRTGKPPTDFGEARTLSARSLKLKATVSTESPNVPNVVRYSTRWERLIVRMQDVRNFRDGCLFLKWLLGAAWFKIITMGRAVVWKLRILSNTLFNGQRNRSG